MSETPRYNPHQVTKDFERELQLYTGAPYAVVVNSCTMALLLACKYMGVGDVTIPKHTYVSVPMSIIHAGGRPKFEDLDWLGAYQLKPYPIFDAARRFTGGMFASTGPEIQGEKFVCVSFHASKILGVEQGGAILHNSWKADPWLRRARFDGRSEHFAPKYDTFISLGYHCYINPSTSAQALLKMHSLSKENDDIPNDDYPDLSKVELFQ